MHSSIMRVILQSGKKTIPTNQDELSSQVLANMILHQRLMSKSVITLMSQLQTCLHSKKLLQKVQFQLLSKLIDRSSKTTKQAFLLAQLVVQILTMEYLLLVTEPKMERITSKSRTLGIHGGVTKDTFCSVLRKAMVSVESTWRQASPLQTDLIESIYVINNIYSYLISLYITYNSIKMLSLY